ncbi:macrolide family glycosyltransferase [Lacrimispora sp.]|jgi:MGT family glycosyltransferase|uniref:macrolide family glycosyltransferase n=1 Tax=Lacrimispora sp. TaxID=2719234 RepID=UPI0028A64433|nr:macrolide family glycosyltransferase [Lacrimispora sp.]
MSNILFVNGNLHGHVNPTLPLVKELVERGKNVWYFGADSFTQPLLEAGAQCLPKSNEMEEFYKNYLPTGKHPFFTILEYMIRLDEVLIPVILKIWKEMSFDCLIYDNVLGAGQFLGQILSIPVIGSFSSFALSRLPVPDDMLKRGTHPQLDEFYQRLDGMCLHYGLTVPDPLHFFQNSGDLNIVYTSKGFNPGSQLLDDSYRFVSPLIREEDTLDFPVELLSEKKVIYISLGTINNQLLDFYQMCMEAFASFDGIVVLSMGKKCQTSDFDHIPDNFIVRQYVPQLEVLKHANLFLSHSGFNSVKESLLFGVPMLLFPMVNDQFLVAKQAAEKGCAIMLSMKEATPDLIREKAEEIISHVEYETACQALRLDFLKTDGIKEVVDEIEEFLANK